MSKPSAVRVSWPLQKERASEAFHTRSSVHRAVAIAAAGVLLEVGGKLYAERQLIGRRHAVVVVVGVERLEVVAVTRGVAPLCVGNESQAQVALLERQLQIVAKY